MKPSSFAREDLKPWHFDEGTRAFEKTDATPNGSGLPPRFTLVTWNVWFDDVDKPKRFEGLLRELQEKDPEVVCLQEVTPELVHRLRESEWARRYFFSDAEGKTVDPHGVLLLSRVPFRSLLRFELPTEMDRKMILAHVEHGGAPLAIATLHLDSQKENGDMRKDQLAVALPVVREAGPDAVVTGDFNFDPSYPEAKGAFEPDFTDAWANLRPADPGYTMDTEKNSMARKTKPKPKQARFDRVLVRSATGAFAPERIEMVGTDPIGPELFPSDHFGLHVVLARR